MIKVPVTKQQIPNTIMAIKPSGSGINILLFWRSAYWALNGAFSATTLPL